MDKKIDKRSPRLLPTVVAAILATLVPIGIYTWSVFFTAGQKDFRPIENIHGIPYPIHTDGTIVITEELAHADVYLTEPVAFKNLELAIEFDPKEIETLSVGIRQDPFWLSYSNRIEIYNRRNQPPSEAIRQPADYKLKANAAVPLTDKIQEKDRSVDLMFFTTGSDKTWELHNLAAHTALITTTYPQIKDYLRSILMQERTL